MYPYTSKTYCRGATILAMVHVGVRGLGGWVVRWLGGWVVSGMYVVGGVLLSFFGERGLNASWYSYMKTEALQKPYFAAQPVYTSFRSMTCVQLGR